MEWMDEYGKMGTLGKVNYHALHAQEGRWDERGPPFMTSELKGERLLPQNHNTAKKQVKGG